MNRNARRAGVKLSAATRNEWHPWVSHADKLSLMEIFGHAVAAYVNNRYSCQVYRRRGGYYHLVIRRHDGGTVVAWHDLQRIKDEMGYSEQMAVQVFPAHDEIVDDANLYHLFVLPEALPVTISGRWE